MEIIVLVIVVVSIALSVLSLRGMLNNSREVARTKKELSKGRVVYQSDSVPAE